MIDMLISIGAPGYLILGAIMLGMIANARIQGIDERSDDNALDHLELVFELVEKDILSQDFMKAVLNRKRNIKSRSGVAGRIVEALLT